MTILLFRVTFLIITVISVIAGICSFIGMGLSDGHQYTHKEYLYAVLFWIYILTVFIILTVYCFNVSNHIVYKIGSIGLDVMVVSIIYNDITYAKDECLF